MFAIALANLHGAFVLVPVFAGLALLEDLIDRDPGARRTLSVGLVATAATLVNPFGAGAWRYALGIATNPVIRDTISEWRPTSVGTISGAVFAASVALLVALFVRRGRPVDLAAIAWLAVFGAIAVPASRGIVLWGLVAPTVAARMLRADETAALSDTSRRMVAVAVALAVVAVVVVPWLRGTTPDALLARAPVGLTEAVDRAVPPGTNLYVWQPWGSWFEFALPEDRVFVDSRIELFSAAVWHEYNDVRLAQGAWSSILRRYDVGAIVIDAENEALLARLWARRDGRRSSRTRTGRCSCATTWREVSRERRPTRGRTGPPGGRPRDASRRRACRRSARGAWSRCARARRAGPRSPGR